MADQDTMLYWLTTACREARKAAGRRHVHVAARVNNGSARDQSTISRFENATAWPRNVDDVVAAYAEDLDIASIDLWVDALQRWQADQRDFATNLEAGVDQSAPDAVRPAKRAQDAAGRRSQHST